MAEFVFLYPIPQIINFELKKHDWNKGGIDGFKKKYKDTLNKCIDERYRQRNFGINYAIFNDSILSDVIDLRPEDKIIKVGVSFKTHIVEKIYPDQDYILSQLNEATIIKIAGFHMWDCVEKLAKRAYEKKLNVLVDEDLTEFFPWRLNDEDFRTNRYPTYQPRKEGFIFFKNFIETRKEKPWLWQNY